MMATNKFFASSTEVKWGAMISLGAGTVIFLPGLLGSSTRLVWARTSGPNWTVWAPMVTGIVGVVESDIIELTFCVTVYGTDEHAPA